MFVRKLLLVAGLMTVGLCANPAFAEFKIAVVDPEGALQNTDAAKKLIDTLNVQLKPKRDHLAQVKAEIEKLEDKAQKDAAIMSDKDKRDLQAQGEKDMQDFQQTKQEAEKTVNDQRQALVQKMYPKMEAALDEMRKAGNYNLILLKTAAVYIDPSIDLTAKLTEKLNAANAAGGQ